MPNEQDVRNPENIQNEPEPADELTSEDLDQVVGAGSAVPTPPPIEIGLPTSTGYKLS